MGPWIWNPFLLTRRLSDNTPRLLEQTACRQPAAVVIHDGGLPAKCQTPLLPTLITRRKSAVFRAGLPVICRDA